MLNMLNSCLPLHNINGSDNKAGVITHFTQLRLQVRDHNKKWDFLVTNLGPKSVILGLPWLHKVNPQINWKEGVLDMEAVQRPPKVNANRKSRRAWVRAGLIEEGDELWLCASYTFLQQITEKQNSEKEMKTLEKMIPAEYRHYMKIFSEEESHRLPEHKPWDHTIELKEGAPKAIHARVFPMSQPEDEKLGRFLDNVLTQGYIVPSKSLMVSPVFFIKKKDRKLHFVQDYRKLNAVTIKNRYPLPLASNIINHLTKAKIFTKFNVRWRYNNIHIKEADQWKVAFITNRASCTLVSRTRPQPSRH